jgi:hypothetical protein
MACLVKVSLDNATVLHDINFHNRGSLIADV